MSLHLQVLHLPFYAFVESVDSPPANLFRKSCNRMYPILGAHIILGFQSFGMAQGGLCW